MRKDLVMIWSERSGTCWTVRTKKMDAREKRTRGGTLRNFPLLRSRDRYNLLRKLLGRPTFLASRFWGRGMIMDCLITLTLSDCVTVVNQMRVRFSITL